MLTGVIGMRNNSLAEHSGAVAAAPARHAILVAINPLESVRLLSLRDARSASTHKKHAVRATNTGNLRVCKRGKS